MTDPVYLTSLQNPRLKALAARRRHGKRDASGTILVEGYDELSLAMATGRVPRSIYYVPGLTHPAKLAKIIKNLPASVEQVVLSPEAFAKIAYRQSPDGWLGEFEHPAVALDQLKLGAKPLVLIAEGMEKPGNLGALLRTADAVRADAVLAASEVTDWANPNVVRASKGTVMTVPVVSASTLDVIAWTKTNGLTLIVASPEAEAVYTDVDLTGPVAVVVGAEHSGVSHELKSAGTLVTIPMRGAIDSLNAATAAALIVYEAIRQREV